MSKTTDKVQWTPELREAVDNRILEYLSQGYSQQEAEEKALLDLLDHTTFIYPEVTVTAQAPVLKQVAVESDWDPGYTKFMSGLRYYVDQDHKNYLNWLRNDYTRGIREATDKWGNAIGTGVEIVSGFTPLWWAAPAVRTGLDLSEGNYKGAALNAGLAFAAPYAIGKGILYVTPHVKSAIIASKLNRLINKTTLPQYSTRYYTKSVGLPGHVNYTLHNADGSVAGGLRVESPYSAGTRGTHIEMVHKTSGSKGGVSEDLYNIAVKDALRAGLPGVESGLDLMNPLLTKHVTSKFPHIEEMIGTPQMVKNPTTGKWEFKQTIPGRMLTGTTSKLLALEAPQGHFITNYSATATNPPPKTSLAFFERLPAKISDAERLGIPKGERNLWLHGTTADVSWNSGLGLGNKKYMLDLTDYHFLQKAPDSKLSYSFSGKPEPMYNGNSGFNGKSSSNDFTVFDRLYIKASEFDPNTGQITVRYNPSDRGFFFSPESRRGTAYTNYGLRKYYLNLKNPRTDSHAFTSGDFLHVPTQNDGVITTISKESLINMVDDGFPFKLPEKGSIWEVQAMDPKVIKLAQWNTYDDAGNLIPLSQRHNFNNSDVRYKSGGSIHIKKSNVKSVNYLNYSK